MAVKLRLQRHGKKDSAFFHIVAADGRAPRDGAFIEKLGTYNPNTNPATIDLNFDKTLNWLMKGAQPTNTCRAILSYKGVLMKKHLLDGVKKGALTETQVEERFANWENEKTSKISTKKSMLSDKAAKANKAKLEAELKTKENIAAKNLGKIQPATEAVTEPTSEISAETETQVKSAE